MSKVEIIHDWLTRHLPDWSLFNVVKAAKYLGVWMGPAAGELQWRDPTTKWEKRAVTVVDLSVGSFDAAQLYNTRAVPVLGYIAQLMPMNPRFARLEKRLSHRLMHIP